MSGCLPETDFGQSYLAFREVRCHKLVAQCPALSRDVAAKAKPQRSPRSVSLPVNMTDTAIGRAIREAKSAGVRRELIDVSLRGLRLRLAKTGAATWVLACRDRSGRMRRFGLGAYPALGISAARDAARTMREGVRHGSDPTADRRRERDRQKAAQAGVGTLAKLLAMYGASPVAPRSWPGSVKVVSSVFKRLLARPVATLTVADMQLIADSHPSAQSAAFAVRCIRPALKWAARPGRVYVPTELAHVHPPTTVKRRERVVSREELTRILPVLRQSKAPSGSALRFLLLTLTRRSEVSSAVWGDISLASRTWTISRTKNGLPHIVPLSDQAIALLRGIGPGMPDEPVFATNKGSGLSAGVWEKVTKDVQKASATAGWHRHDLRRTGATMLGEMGELPDIIEAALNHVSIRSPLAATYNRSRYRPQVAAALQRLADALDGIESGAASVVPLHVAAG